MVFKCAGCWKNECECICGPFRTAPVQDTVFVVRRFRRMTEEEQKATGFPTDSESLRDGVSPIEVVLGYDPFLTYEDIECVTPPSGAGTYLKE